jgi:hypothetical protein
VVDEPIDHGGDDSLRAFPPPPVPLGYCRLIDHQQSVAAEPNEFGACPAVNDLSTHWLARPPARIC